MDNTTEKTQDTAQADLLLRPDGNPYKDEFGCQRRKLALEKQGKQVQVVDYKGGVALKIVGKTGRGQDQAGEGSVPPGSGQSGVAEHTSSGNGDPLSSKRRELAALDEELRLEEEIARKRARLQTLNRSNLPTNRPHRRSVSVRNRLVATQVPGMKRVFVNDSVDGRRIQDMEARGYNLVTDPDADSGIEVKGDPKIATRLGAAVSQVVGQDNAGRPVKAYLMEMPIEEYEAIQREKQDDIAQQERGLFRVPDGLRGMGNHPQLAMVPVGTEDEAQT